MNKIYRAIKNRFIQKEKNRKLSNLYFKFKDFTMIPKECYMENLELASKVIDVAGCVVECGVWRGGMIAGISEILGEKRRYYLFDSFQGLPPAKEIDGESAMAWQKAVSSPTYHDNCTAPEEMAIKAMELAGVKNFKTVPGWFNETIPFFPFPEKISYLRLDADWYASTEVCLKELFFKVCPNGLIVIDDYYTWDGCSRAVHDFLSKHSLTERIRSFGSICYIKKD